MEEAGRVGPAEVQGVRSVFCVSPLTPQCPLLKQSRHQRDQATRPGKTSHRRSGNEEEERSLIFEYYFSKDCTSVLLNFQVLKVEMLFSDTHYF